jgi:hypothetical protein
MYIQTLNGLFKVDPAHEVVLDVSSTSSDSDDNYITPLTELRAAELKSRCQSCDF